MVTVMDASRTDADGLRRICRLTVRSDRHARLGRHVPIVAS
jgi:hypothetical protein